MKKNDGITLVALVITIIVMLILAGVTIAAVVNGGLFEKAQTAGEQTKIAAEKEKIDSIIAEYEMQKYGQNPKTLREMLEGYGYEVIEGENGIEVILSDGTIYALNIEENFDGTVNAPKVLQGMIPVYYDNGWKKADISNSGNNWYQYDTTNRKWANAVTVKENGTQKRTDYQKGGVGTAITEEDIIGMYVWIPRYAYKITSGYHTAANGTGEIEIKFLKEGTDNYEGGTSKRNNKTNEDYVVHPAFTKDTTVGGGAKEITGFWVAKFEASSSETTGSNPQTGTAYGGGNTIGNQEVTIRPSVISWRAIDVNNIYTVCKNMNKEGNIHGLTSGSNPHMIKNSEWGAIAYLTQSEYGNKQSSGDSGVWSNSYHNGDNSYGTKTGCVGGSRDVLTANGTATTIYSKYNEGNGPKGSTTRNVYGIYDMAGGAWEYVAGYLGAGTNSYVTFFKTLAESEKQEYLGTGASSDRATNYQENKNIYGDAIWETASDSAATGGNYGWNNDWSDFISTSVPFFVRRRIFH